MTQVLLKPLITEKLTNIGEQYNRYGFVVNKTSNKLEIKKAIEDMYGVSVKEVKTIVMPGKAKQRHTKAGVSKGVTGSYKKAIVSLADGDTIDFYSNI